METTTDRAIEKTMDYSGSFVYEDNELKYILTGEGRVMANSNGTYDYHYFLKDHLGNTRITFNQNGTIIQKDSYYPFGMEMTGLGYQNGSDAPNKYLYNGKLKRSGNPAEAGELQDEFGLGWYDYGARFYDAQLGRWHIVDPLAEKYYSLTSYNYTANNPIAFIDPDGMRIEWGDMSKKDKKLIRKSIRQWKKSSTYRNVWKQLKRSDYTYKINSGTTPGGSAATFMGSYDKLMLGMPDEETGIPDAGFIDPGGNPGGSITFDLNPVQSSNKKMFSKSEQTAYLSNPALEEIIHAGQYDYYVHQKGQLDTDNPAKGNVEFEAKTISGIVKSERGVPLSLGSESIPQEFGQGLLNNTATLNRYFNTADRWKSHPQTSSIYKRKRIQQIDPKYLIWLLNK